MREQVLIFTPPAATSYRQLDRFLGLLAPQPPTEWRPKYLPVFSAFCCCLGGPECNRERGARDATLSRVSLIRLATSSIGLYS